MPEHDLPYAHELPCWKTGKSSPDVWIERAKEVITKLGGELLQEAFGASNGRSAYMIRFQFGDETFRIVWPVLKTRMPSEDAAARVQAATLLYHDCKAKMVAAQVLGTRTAFFYALELPGGKVMAEIATPALMSSIPNVALIGHAT